LALILFFERGLSPLFPESAVMSSFFSPTMKSEVNHLELISAEESLVAVSFKPGFDFRGEPNEKAQQPSRGVLSKAYSQLEEYFRGKRKHFSIPLRTNLSIFQASVLAEVLKIPYGEVISYQDLAIRIGKPGAARAVGSALGKNPIPIFIPCHRVIGSDGRLTGFVGGLDWKRYLIKLESN
jgi:methylated-DNA-[protein]-cysteine S-methyltransferase